MLAAHSGSWLDGHGKATQLVRHYNSSAMETSPSPVRPAALRKSGPVTCSRDRSRACALETGRQVSPAPQLCHDKHGCYDHGQHGMGGSSLPKNANNAAVLPWSNAMIFFARNQVALWRATSRVVRLADSESRDRGSQNRFRRPRRQSSRLPCRKLGNEALVDDRLSHMRRWPSLWATDCGAGCCLGQHTGHHTAVQEYAAVTHAACERALRNFTPCRAAKLSSSLPLCIGRPRNSAAWPATERFANGARHDLPQVAFSASGSGYSSVQPLSETVS